MVETQVQSKHQQAKSPRWEVWYAFHYRNCSCKEPPLLCCVEMGTEEYYVHYIDGQTFLIAYMDTCDRRTLDFVVVKIEEKAKRPKTRVKYKIEANDVWFAKLSDIEELMREAKREGGKLLVFKEGGKLFGKFFWEVGEIEGYWKQVEIQA